MIAELTLNSNHSLTNNLGRHIGLGLWYLTPLSTIFQLNRGGLVGYWVFKKAANFRVLVNSMRHG